MFQKRKISIHPSHTHTHTHGGRERKREGERRRCKHRAERNLKVDLEDWSDVATNQETPQPPEAIRGEEQILPLALKLQENKFLF